jgi:hypothetical protein
VREVPPEEVPPEVPEVGEQGEKIFGLMEEMENTNGAVAVADAVGLGMKPRGEHTRSIRRRISLTSTRRRAGVAAAAAAAALTTPTAAAAAAAAAAIAAR